MSEQLLLPERLGLKSRALFYGYILAGYSFVMGFVASSFFLHSRGIFFPHWMEEFAVDRTEISLVISVVLFTGSCIAPFTGFFIDKKPVKYIIMFGSTWLAIGYFLLAYTDSYISFFVTLLLFQSLGWTCVGPLVQTKLMVNWFSRNRGMALGIAIMGISVAGIIMPTVATYLADQLGWQGTYRLYALVLLFFVIPLTLIMVVQQPTDMNLLPDGDSKETDTPVATTSTSAQQTLWQTYREFLTSKAFWSVVITFGLMNGVYSALITHLPSYLTQERSYDMYDASYVLGIAGGFAIAGKIVFGWMMDNLSARATVMTAVTAYFSSTLIFMFVENYWLIGLAAGLFGLGFGGMVPVRSVLLSRLFGIAKFSRVNGLFAFFLAPATFWVLITGWVTDMTGTYQTAFKIWAVSFFLAGIVSFLIRLPDREDAVA